MGRRGGKISQRIIEEEITTISISQIDYNKVIQDRISASVGLDNYKKIMETVDSVDVSKDGDFQKLFNGFYRVRRELEWRNKYYDLFESCKHGKVEFKYILENLYELTGNIEASFSSKMLATLDCTKPIWDQYVVKALALKVPGQYVDKDIRLERTIQLYDEIEDWYKEYLLTDNAEKAINRFDELMPDYTWISSVKKVDFYLWSIR